MVGEEELGGPAIARVWKWPTIRADGGYPVDKGDGFVVERDHPLGIQLAQGNLEPCSVARDLMNAVEL